MLHAKLARITEISTSTGVDLHVVENWCAGFFMLDDSEGWSDGNIDRADLDLALKVLGDPQPRATLPCYSPVIVMMR